MANVGLITCYSSPEGAMAVSTPSYTFTPTSRLIAQLVVPQYTVSTPSYTFTPTSRLIAQLVVPQYAVSTPSYADVRTIRGVIPSVGVVASSTSTFRQYWG